MRQLDPTIVWLRNQAKNASQTLTALNAGQTIESDGVDVTDLWIPRYERLVERYQRLIAIYTQRNRDSAQGAE
jgi:hypothetical protein